MLKRLILNPGIDREGTEYSAEGTWYNSDKVRFRKGRPEQIGGWDKSSDNTFLGTCRGLHNWSSIDKDDYMSVTTNLKSYIEIGGAYYDVTPKRYYLQTVLKTALGTGTTTSVEFEDALVDDSIIRINNEYI